MTPVAWPFFARNSVPAALAYGANPPPGTGIGPDATLKFDLELVKINTQ